MRTNIDFSALIKQIMFCFYLIGLYHISCIPNGGMLVAIAFFVFSCAVASGMKEFIALPKIVFRGFLWSIAGYGEYCIFQWLTT